MAKITKNIKIYYSNIKNYGEYEVNSSYGVEIMKCIFG
jgi:hypothetical protein